MTGNWIYSLVPTRPFLLSLPCYSYTQTKTHSTTKIRWHTCTHALSHLPPSTKYSWNLCGETNEVGNKTLCVVCVICVCVSCLGLTALLSCMNSFPSWSEQVLLILVCFETFPLSGSGTLSWICICAVELWGVFPSLTVFLGLSAGCVCFCWLVSQSCTKSSVCFTESRLQSHPCGATHLTEWFVCFACAEK